MEIECFCKDNTQASTKQFNRIIKNSILMLAVLGLIVVVLGVISLVGGKDLPDYDASYGIYLIVWGILFPLVLGILFYFIFKKQYTSNKIYFGNVTFKFNDEQFSYEIKNENSTANVVAKYNSLYKAIENKDSFIFYISSNSFTILDKSSEITGGNFADLRLLLNEKLGKKFTIKGV